MSKSRFKVYSVATLTAIIASPYAVQAVTQVDIKVPEEGVYFTGLENTYLTINDYAFITDDALNRLFGIYGFENIHVVIGKEVVNLEAYVFDGAGFSPYKPGDVPPGEYTTPDGKTTVIVEGLPKDLQNAEVSSIDKTGVTVTFPSLEEDIIDQTIKVIDPDGTEVAVKAQDLAKSATEATFEFVTELDELTPGTWIVNGKEFVVEENTTKENETKRYLAS